MIDTPEWRIFLMKDLAAMEGAQKHGAKIIEVDVKF
jgi:glycerophosphoryl diester phosphodiesterase